MKVDVGMRMRMGNDGADGNSGAGADDTAARSDSDGQQDDGKLGKSSHALLNPRPADWLRAFELQAAGCSAHQLVG